MKIKSSWSSNIEKHLNKRSLKFPLESLKKVKQPDVCAKRELEEETGYECESLELLNSFYTSPGFADEIVHVYLAKGLTKKEDAAGLDEDEFVNLRN